MFCENCGELLDDGAVFCVKCGQRVAPVQAQEEMTEAVAPTQEGVTEVATQTQEGATEAVAQPRESVAEATDRNRESTTAAFTEPVQPAYTAQSTDTQPRESAMEKPVKAKKASKMVWIFGAVAAVVVVLVAVVAVHFQTLANSVRKMTMSPQEYYAYIENKQLLEMTSRMAENYDKSMGAYGDMGNQKLEYSLDVELGELLCDTIGSALAVEDVSGLSKMGLDFLLTTNEDIFSGGIGARLGDTTLISLNGMVDIGKGMVYGQLPELSDKYISTDISAEADELNAFFEEYTGMMELYPEGAVLEDMLNRYVTIMIDSFGDVTEESAVVTVGEFEEKCTKLCATMTEAEAYDMLETMLEEAKGDEALMDMMVGFASYAEMGMSEQTARESLLEAMEEGLASIAANKENADPNNQISMTILVNNKGELVGRAFEVKPQEFVISYMMPQKKDLFGYELKAGNGENIVTIEGTGTKTDVEMTGEFLIAMDSEEYGDLELFTITIEHMDMEKYEEGLLDISCRLKPEADLYSLLSVGELGMFLAGYELIYETDVEVNQAEVAISLMNGNELVFKLVVGTEIGEAPALEVPKDSILVETDEDLIEWMVTMDFDKFMKNIEQSDMPAELVELIRSYISELQTLAEYYNL